MSDQRPSTSLYAKLAQVVAELGYVAKDGKNDFHNYRYTSAEALLAAVRGPLSARGVVLMPSLTAVSEREYTTQKGKASIITTAHVKFTFVDGESGEKHECEWAGQGDDPADKGLSKAFTSAAKTFLREQFLIPQGDDPEADPKSDERGADRAPARATAGLPDATVQIVVDAIRRARMGTEWVRSQLVALGVDNVPAGTLTQGTIRALSAEQADKLVIACMEAAEGRDDGYAGDESYAYS